MSVSKPRVSIGLPAYNGEASIRRTIDSVLNQTFTDFKLIISDNASTDSTSLICEEYAKKDKRILYIRQKKNIGVTANWRFVQNQANSQYFAWIGADDIMLPQFLEKNVRILDSEKNVVASMSKIMLFGAVTDSLKNYQNDIFFTKVWKKIRLYFRNSQNTSLSGSYKSKVRKYLKKDKLNSFLFAVFRTHELRTSLIKDSFVGDDVAVVLNVLKRGDFYVVDEVLMHKFDGGMSTSGVIDYAKKFNNGKIGFIFLSYPFTLWCIRNLGGKVFLKNLDHFIYRNFMRNVNLFLDVLRRLRKI